MDKNYLFEKFVKFMEESEPNCDSSEYYEEYFRVWLDGYKFAGGTID